MCSQGPRPRVMGGADGFPLLAPSLLPLLVSRFGITPFPFRSFPEPPNTNCFSFTSTLSLCVCPCLCFSLFLSLFLSV